MRNLRGVGFLRADPALPVGKRCWPHDALTMVSSVSHAQQPLG